MLPHFDHSHENTTSYDQPSVQPTDLNLDPRPQAGAMVSPRIPRASGPMYDRGQELREASELAPPNTAEGAGTLIDSAIALPHAVGLTPSGREDTGPSRSPYPQNSPETAAHIPPIESIGAPGAGEEYGGTTLEAAGKGRPEDVVLPAGGEAGAPELELDTPQRRLERAISDSLLAEDAISVRSLSGVYNERFTALTAADGNKIIGVSMVDHPENQVLPAQQEVYLDMVDTERKMHVGGTYRINAAESGFPAEEWTLAPVTDEFIESWREGRRPFPFIGPFRGEIDQTRITREQLHDPSGIPDELKETIAEALRGAVVNPELTEAVLGYYERRGFVPVPLETAPAVQPYTASMEASEPAAEQGPAETSDENAAEQQTTQDQLSPLDEYAQYIKGQITANIEAIGSPEKVRQTLEQAIESADVDGYLDDAARQTLVDSIINERTAASGEGSGFNPAWAAGYVDPLEGSRRAQQARNEIFAIAMQSSANAAEYHQVCAETLSQYGWVLNENEIREILTDLEQRARYYNFEESS